MTDAGIPMGEGLASALARLGSKIEAGEIAGGLTQPFNGKRYFVVSQEQYEHDTRRSPADTPPPAAAGDRALAEARAEAAKLRDALGSIASWCCPVFCQNCATNRDAALAALRTPEPNSGGEVDQ